LFIKLTSCDDGNQVLTNGFLLKIFSIKLSSLKFKLQQSQFQIKLHQNWFWNLLLFIWKIWSLLNSREQKNQKIKKKSKKIEKSEKRSKSRNSNNISDWNSINFFI